MKHEGVCVLYSRNQQISWSLRKIAFVSFILVIPFLLAAFANLFQWQWLEEADSLIGQFIIRQRSEPFTALFRFFTTFVNPDFAALVIGIIFLFLLLFLKEKQLAFWYVLTTAIGAGLLNQLVKHLFKKERPTVEHLIVQDGYSFPSGHAMGSVIIYGALCYVLLKKINRTSIQVILILATIGLIILVGLSRIYLGVHFPSDIVGGYALGASWLSFCIGLYEMRLVRKMNRTD